MFTPDPFDDDGYDDADPKSPGWADRITDRADNHREATE